MLGYIRNFRNEFNETLQQPKTGEFCVYTRRYKHQFEKALQPSLHGQDSDLAPEFAQSQGNSNLELILAGDKDDVEIDHNEHVSKGIDDGPIALRKGKRTCTKHSILNFLSYGKLSPAHRAFVSSLDVYVPRPIHEAVLEEVYALEKNETWVVTKLPVGKKVVSRK